MANKQWQCFYCGIQKSSLSIPTVSSWCKNESKKHDMRDMGKPEKDNAFWRCIYCGRIAPSVNNGYPVASDISCLARKKMPCIWEKLLGFSNFYIKWKCTKCQKNPLSTDDMLRNKKIPSPTGGVKNFTGCVGNKPHYHIWQFQK